MRVDMFKEEGAETSKIDTKSETLNHFEYLTESQRGRRFLNIPRSWSLIFLHQFKYLILIYQDGHHVQESKLK